MKKALCTLSLAPFALVLLAGASIAPAAEPAPALPAAPDAEASAPASAELLDLQPAHTPVSAPVAPGDEIGRMACNPPECGTGNPCPGGGRCVAKCCV